MTTLYNCHHDGLDYRITKFEDGNPTSSYLCSAEACECPAGARPTCRHRQMLPLMINLALPNQPWFLDWDNGKRVVDFNGNELPPVPEGLHDTAEASPINDLFNLPQYHGVSIKQVESIEQTDQPTSWRRL